MKTLEDVSELNRGTKEAERRLNELLNIIHQEDLRAVMREMLNPDMDQRITI